MPQSPLGFTALNAKNANTPGRLGAQGDLFTGQRHGSRYAAAFAGSLGLIQNPTPVTTSVGLATTYVGLCLSNPAASGKNLAIISVSAQFAVAPATITNLYLILGYAAAGIVTHTTPLTPLNGLVGVGGNALVGLADSACTLVGTPAAALALGQASTATTAPFALVTLDGGIILPPGAYAAIGTNIAGPANGFIGGFTWEEV